MLDLDLDPDLHQPPSHPSMASESVADGRMCVFYTHVPVSLPFLLQLVMLQELVQNVSPACCQGQVQSPFDCDRSAPRNVQMRVQPAARTRSKAAPVAVLDASSSCLPPCAVAFAGLG